LYEGPNVNGLYERLATLASSFLDLPRERWRRSLMVAGVALLIVLLAVLLYRDLLRGLQNPDAIRKGTFEGIYAQGRWGTDEQGKGTSGSGSTMESTKIYRAFLQDFLAAHRIRSVVDAGCGDWEFSQAIDWKGIDYLGVDIVESVIKADQHRFSAANVRFAVADIVHDELPPADLLLVKEVLQHLSHADIARFLVQLPRYRHVLIVNDVNPTTLTAEPVDIASGGYRWLDLTRPPYALQGAKVLVYREGAHAKLVLYLSRVDEPAPASRAPSK
jgi:SAM-dependent methyltransferase